MRIVGVYGAAGHGREVMGMLPKAADTNYVFIDDDCGLAKVNDYPCLSWVEFKRTAASAKHVILAIGDGKVRERLSLKCKEAGIGFMPAHAQSAVILSDVRLGEGSVLCPYSMITCNVTIGRQFHANYFSHVSHDCRIGDFVTLAPGARCNGNVVIEDHAYIGSSAVLRQGRPGDPLVIGAGAIVGMGAVVTQSVPAGATVVGNPARLMEPK
ncbi:acetyltransferase [Altererythrobacter litoralis]|uniref:Acetyltransferase n=1 Tax=Altererythrobacter litoralis TaxID=3113904 RepID=A0ABU7GEY9_9SPHN|nr:acetyltransferase [Erythrobacteraceae bacterium 1XM1-14]